MLIDDVHLLTARQATFAKSYVVNGVSKKLASGVSTLLMYKLRRGGKIYSSQFGAREVCIASQNWMNRYYENIGHVGKETKAMVVVVG